VKKSASGWGQGLRLLALAGMAAMGVVQAAWASNFEIAPVVLELSSSRTAGVIKIVNNDNHNVSLQLRAYDWNQADSKDELQPSQNLILSPRYSTSRPAPRR
jgi:fimbrial chaperone protein